MLKEKRCKNPAKHRKHGISQIKFEKFSSPFLPLIPSSCRANAAAQKLRPAFPPYRPTRPRDPLRTAITSHQFLPSLYCPPFPSHRCFPVSCHATARGLDIMFIQIVSHDVPFFKRGIMVQYRHAMPKKTAHDSPAKPEK